MQVGDKVRVYGEETEIVATAFDEQGEKVYMLKGYTRDFYEDEFGPMKFFLLESIIDLTTEELDKKDKNTTATLGYEELVQLRDLWTKKVSLEVDLEATLKRCDELEKERDGIYSDYQDLGKELSLKQEREEQIKKAEQEVIDDCKKMILGGFMMALCVAMTIGFAIEKDWIWCLISIIWIATFGFKTYEKYRNMDVNLSVIGICGYIKGLEVHKKIEKGNKYE